MTILSLRTLILVPRAAIVLASATDRKGSQLWNENASTPVSKGWCLLILGFHPRDETAMLLYKTIKNGSTSSCIIIVSNFQKTFCTITLYTKMATVTSDENPQHRAIFAPFKTMKRKQNLGTGHYLQVVEMRNVTLKFFSLPLPSPNYISVFISLKK